MYTCTSFPHVQKARPTPLSSASQVSSTTAGDLSIIGYILRVLPLDHNFALAPHHSAANPLRAAAQSAPQQLASQSSPQARTARSKRGSARCRTRKVFFSNDFIAFACPIMEHASTHTEPWKIKAGRLGGLKHLERLLGTRQDGVLSTDAVFVSLDLEVASDRQRLHLSAEKPVVRQLAFASLDTRDIHAISVSSDLKSLISLQMFEVSAVSPRSKKAVQGMAKEKRCLFAQTQSITLEEVSSTIVRNLRIKDSLAGPGDSCLRSIVLVGHSLGQDLKILRLLGIDPARVGPISTIIDTHSMARFLFPPYHPNHPLQPGQDFSLAGVLAELGCLLDRSGFHNAGNDAVYSLHAMLLLAIKAGTAREADLGKGEWKNLETLRSLVTEAVGLNQPP